MHGANLKLVEFHVLCFVFVSLDRGLHCEAGRAAFTYR
jgi:hypothetical protein